MPIPMPAAAITRRMMAMILALPFFSGALAAGASGVNAVICTASGAGGWRRSGDPAGAGFASGGGVTSETGGLDIGIDRGGGVLVSAAASFGLGVSGAGVLLSP